MPGCRTWQEVAGAGAGLLLNQDSPQARGVVCAGWTTRNVPRDVTQYRNHATTNTAAYKATDRGLALSSSAGSEIVTDTAGGGLALGATDPWSISFWHYTRAYVSLAQVFGYGIALGDSSGGGFNRYVLQFSDNYYFWGAAADWASGVAWDVGSWRFIEFVSTGADLLLYRDGILAASRGSLPSLATSYANITAFSQHLSAASSPNMLLVDPRIYNVGHSAAEVAAMYSRPHDLYWRKSRSAPKQAAAGGVFAPYYYREHIARYAG